MMMRRMRLASQRSLARHVFPSYRGAVRVFSSSPSSSNPSSHDREWWLDATNELLRQEEWTPSHKRKAEQCLEFWSQNHIASSSSSSQRPRHRRRNNDENNHNSNHDENNTYGSSAAAAPSQLLELWNKAQREIPSQETTAALYDYTILALAKNDMAIQANDVLNEFLEKDFIYSDQHHHKKSPKSDNNDDNNNNSASTWHRHVPHSYHLNAVLHSYARNQQPEEAERLLKQSCALEKERDDKDDNVELKTTIHSVTSVLDAWSRVGDGHRALLLLEWVRQHTSMDVTVAAYNAVLAAWARSTSLGDANHETRVEASRQAQELLRTMPVEPDAKSWSSVLVATASHSPPQAEQLLWKAMHNQEPINTVCWNVILHAWGKSSGGAAKAEQLLRQWIDLVGASTTTTTTTTLDSDETVVPALPKSLWPDLTSFNTVLGALARHNHDKTAAQRANQWLTEMQEVVGVLPDAISINSVLDAFAKRGQATEARRLLDQLLHHPSHEPHQLRIGYNAYISALANENKNNKRKKHQRNGKRNNFYDDNDDDKPSKTVGIVKEIMGEMRQSGLTPNRITYNAYLKALASEQTVSAAEEAHDVLHQMERSLDDNGGQGALLPTPDIFSYTTVIDAWAKSGARQSPQKAYEVLQHLLHQQDENGAFPDEPNVVSFNTVMSACAKARDHDNKNEVAEIAQEVFEELSRRGGVPDTWSCSSLVACWSNSHYDDKAQRCHDFLRQMQQTMLEKKKKRKDNRNDDNDDDQRLLSMERNAHNFVLKACAYTPKEAGEENRNHALRIAHETFDETPAPNHVTYTSYLQALYHLEEDTDTRHQRMEQVCVLAASSQQQQQQQQEEEEERQRRRREQVALDLVLRRLKRVTPRHVYRDICNRLNDML